VTIHRAYDSQRGTIRRAKGEKIRQERALGGHLAWLLIPLAAALVAAGAVLWPHSHPGVISNTHLAGARSPAPVNVLVLADMSGSFTGCDQIRRDGLQQILTWAPANMRGDDTFTIISFAANAILTMPTTSVADIAKGETTLSSAVPDSTNTTIQPALTLATNSLESPANTSIVALTDTKISDPDQAAISSLLTTLGVTSMSVITPTGTPIDPGWNDAFSWEQHYQADSTDAQGVGLAVGQALAHATGQTLKPGPAPKGVTTTESSTSSASPPTSPLAILAATIMTHLDWVGISVGILGFLALLVAIMIWLFRHILFRHDPQQEDSAQPHVTVPRSLNSRIPHVAVVPETDNLSSPRHLDDSMANLG